MANKIDSNLTTMAFAEETSLKTVSGSAVWYGLDVNSYGDFGTNVEKVSREPINGTRQKLKGSVSFVSASAGFNVDLTKSCMSRLMQGFMFKNIVEPFSTKSTNSAQIPVTAVAAGTGVYSAASGLTFVANQLVRCSGFTNAANNGIFKVTSSTTTALTTNNAASVVETPTTAASIEVIGFEFASAALAMTVSASAMTLTASSGGSALQALTVGQWVFIGGDVAGSTFATGGSGFARVLSTSATTAVFDKTTFTPVADAGTGKSIRIYYSTMCNNAATGSAIVTRSYQLERQLGNDGSGIQSEYMVGAVPNEFSMSFKQKEKITCDLSFIALDGETRTGAVGVKAGSRVSLNGSESGYNASQDVYRTSIAPYSPTVLNSPATIGFLTDASFSIKNNVSVLEAIGEVTGFDVNIGSFDIDGSFEAYFTSLSAVTAIRDNGDITIDYIISAPTGDGTYHGKIFDIPLIELADGKVNVVKDQSIKLPLSAKGLKSEAGYTASYSEFKVLPVLAAPL